MTATLTMLITLTERLIALAVALQTLELLQIRAVCADHGVWRFALLRAEYALLPFPVRQLCELCCPYRPFLTLLCVRLGCALLLLGTGLSGVLPLLWASQALICIRFRGSFNGGSDSMSMVVLTAGSVAAISGHAVWADKLALYYIAVQVTLSYVVAGLAKLQHADWRDGRALQHFVAAGAYGVPESLGRARWLRNQGLCRLLAWGVIGFECLFPCAWLGPRACLIMLALGLTFHAVNAFVFGLNRFVFAWAAAYPALLYCTQSLQGPL
jgi:Vitamin K-dependent gamma-carboxylase